MEGIEMEVPIESTEYAQPQAPRETYFVGSVPRLKLHFSYQFSLTLVALAMILLPAIYLGIMASVGWGAWWWATHASDWLFPHERGGRRIYFFLLLIYVAPIP